MPFKVRCRLVEFMGDVERFPCHFEYKIGDEFIFDGEKFVGRICPGLFAAMVPVISTMYRSGNAWCERIVFRYHGLSVKDESMKDYDGQGWRPLRKHLEGTEGKYIRWRGAAQATEILGGWQFVCQDARTSALFKAEPYDLADLGDAVPDYTRQMSILDKIKAEPGLTPEEVIARFSDWERDEIYPPLIPLNTKILMDELATVGYIEYRDGRAYPKSSPK